MRVFRKLCLLTYVWLCCCCMDCGPMDFNYNPGYVKALKPADVDSLEMRIYSNDSLIATEYSRSSESGGEASFSYEDFCKGDEHAGKSCDFTIAITFFCGDKTVALPTYIAKTKTSSDGLFADEVKYYIAEFDERKVSGDYSLETFLAPEDAACGKFVNYTPACQATIRPARPTAGGRR